MDFNTILSSFHVKIHLFFILDLNIFDTILIFRFKNIGIKSRLKSITTRLSQF